MFEFHPAHLGGGVSYKGSKSVQNCDHEAQGLSNEKSQCKFKSWLLFGEME
jgi:hypothetical protein